MSDTFAELGIPFPLFEGPVDDAAEYMGIGDCSLCARTKQHCFRLDIGCAIVADCPACGTASGLDANDRKKTHCRKCRTAIPFPRLRERDIKACYTCLLSGKAAITKDTELGMISWDEALAGVTHGRPGLSRSDFELVPRESGWVGVRLPQEIMLELLRTPTYISIQGDCWQFCCRRPMVFLGRWTRDEFTRRAPDGNGQRLFEEIVQNGGEELWSEYMDDMVWVYVFRCPSCGRKTAHWDND